jgi:hypothetical protein
MLCDSLPGFKRACSRTSKSLWIQDAWLAFFLGCKIYQIAFLVVQQLIASSGMSSPRSRERLWVSFSAKIIKMSWR